MENLNKENFWDKMMINFPLATKSFCDWIDQYKKEVNWDSIFANETAAERQDVQMKFHDIPIEMQEGIINRFFIEKGLGWNTPPGASSIREITLIKLRMLNNQLNGKKSKKEK